MLQAPTIFDELEGEVVEKFGMARQFSGGAEVIGGADDAGTVEPVPDAIDHDACGERMIA